MCIWALTLFRCNESNILGNDRTLGSRRVTPLRTIGRRLLLLVIGDERVVQAQGGCPPLAGAPLRSRTAHLGIFYVAKQEAPLDSSARGQLYILERQIERGVPSVYISLAFSYILGKPTYPKRAIDR